MIYLDHAATTKPDPAVIAAMAEAMDRCARDCWRNPSAAYGAAGDARRELRRARQAVAALLNAAPQEIVFTSGGTEANNQALLSARGGHAVVSAIEHASVLRAARALCREVTLVAPDERGRVSPEAVRTLHQLSPGFRISTRAPSAQTVITRDVPDGCSRRFSPGALATTP